MKPNIKFLFFPLLTLALLAGCATTPSSTSSRSRPPQVSGDRVPAPSGKVWIRKFDGSMFCHKRQGRSAQEMVRELQTRGITVFEFRKARDKEMHMLVCGAPTGHQTEALIGEQHLDIARQLGFSEKLQISE